MSVPVLVVEERLRVVLVYLDAMKHLALLVDEPVSVPQFDSPRQFSKWVAHMATVAAENVSAVRAALPPSCSDLYAPIAGGGR